MRRSNLFLAALGTLCLASTPLWAQTVGNGVNPADTRPSLVTPPGNYGAATNGSFQNNNSSYNNAPQHGSEPQYQPLESFPRAVPSPSYGSDVVGSSAMGACECQPAAAPSYQPTVRLSPVTLPPAAYSSTYVPPPPASASYPGRVAYQQPVTLQRPIIYQQTVPQSVVYRPVTPQAMVYRPATPMVGPAGASYALPPLIPVQNVPAGAAIGRGVLGQPTVYVPGQPVRNFLRYLSP